MARRNISKKGRGNTGEPEINIALAEVLQNISASWEVKGQPVGVADGEFPDITVIVHFANPVVIETEIFPATKVEGEAYGRLGMKLDGKTEVSTVIAVKLPLRLTHFKHSALRREILKTKDFEYAVHVGGEGRAPASGWMVGTVRDLALAARVSSAPDRQVREYVKILSSCMNEIEDIIDDLSDSTHNKISKILNQPPSGQTWKMAGLILSNAMIFYDMVSDKIKLDSGKTCKTLAELRAVGNVISQEELCSAWRDILEHNYNPIFKVASDILATLGGAAAGKVIAELYKAASLVQSNNMSGSADMYGMLFQRVISDRSHLASYYTMPEAAALIAAMATPRPNDPVYSRNNISKYRVADFACGTGLLLLSVYRQLIFNHDASKPNARRKLSAGTLHKKIMEQCIVGLDVLPIAAHLTVSSLAMMFPTQIFDDTNVKTLPIGRRAGDSPTDTAKKGKTVDYRLGSCELIVPNRETLDQDVKPVSGKDVQDDWWDPKYMHHFVEDGSCDLVVMNPPFVGNTTHTGKHEGETMPAWAAFDTTHQDQKTMSKRATEIFRNTCSNGNAGIGTYFMVIADKKAAKDGTLAIVLPSTIAKGDAWKKTRKMMEDGYGDIVVVSIADRRITQKTRSFSSDTEMGEIILLGKKRSSLSGLERPRGLFVSLSRKPVSALEAAWIGNAITSADSASVDRLESERGGTSLAMGDVRLGSMLTCPLEDLWFFVSVADPFMEQLAYGLGAGRHTKCKFADAGSLFKVGKGHRDIAGSGLRGPFIRMKIRGNPKYAALWNNVQKQQTRMVMPPDTQLEPKPDATDEYIDSIWKKASRVHINVNPRFNANSLVAAYTKRKVLGGSTWPSILMEERYEKPFVAWCNSSMGIVCYWLMAGKQQLGRGRASRSTIPYMQCPDFTKMDDADIADLSRIFDEYGKLTFDRINNLWKDETRIEMDSKIARVLGADLDLDDLRRRLCVEPSISGGESDKALFDGSAQYGPQ